MSDKPTYEFKVVAVPNFDGPPVIIRLRKFLKAALRAYGLRCVDCRETPRRSTESTTIEHGTQETTGETARQH